MSVKQAILKPTCAHVESMLRRRGKFVNRRTIQRLLREAVAAGKRSVVIGGVEFSRSEYPEAEERREEVDRVAIVNSLPTPERCWQLAAEADCIRRATVRRGWRSPYEVVLLVPPTSHWANWRDDDAIIYHGRKADSLIDRFAALSEELWDGTYAHLWDFRGLAE